jgi:hypothetical protein
LPDFKGDTMQENLMLYRNDFASRNYELKSKDTTKAILQFINRKSDDAIIIIDNMKWHVSKKGKFKLEILIHNDDNTKETARIEYGINKWIMKGLNNYMHFQFKNTKFWKYTWDWIDDKGNKYMEYIPNISLDEIGRVIIKKQIESDMVMNFMAAIGWYLLIINKNDCCAFSALVDTGLMS